MNNKILKFINFNNICFWFSVTVYVFFTIYVISLRVPFFDEINAWNISQNCSFVELFEVCPHEGHFLLWYLLLKPFALFNIAFPTSMFAINWIFAFCAVLVLWYRAPFNPLIKTFITFSLPVQIFTVYARCYSIGMLIIFVLCALYKYRFKRHLLYSFLIILLANTSVIGSLIAFVFGIIYFCEAVINRNKRMIETAILSEIFLVFLLGVTLVLSQVLFYVIPPYSVPTHRLHMFFDFFSFNFDILRDIALVFLFFVLFLGSFFFKRKISLYLFLLFSNILILCLSYFIYPLSSFHYMFLYINVIAAVWIYYDEYKIQSLLQKFIYYLFVIMCFCLVFYWKHNWYWNGMHLPAVNYIKQNIDKFDGSNVFLFSPHSHIGVVPSLRNYNINFYNTLGYSFKSYLLYIHQWDANQIDLNRIKNIMNKGNKTNYLFLQRPHFVPNDKIFMDYISNHSDKLKFSLYKQFPDLVIYIIEEHE